MVEAARSVPTMVWFNYRRVPAIAFARQLIDEGRLGTVFHYNAAYRQQWGADHVARRDLADGSGAGGIGRGRRPADAPARHRAVSERADHGGHGRSPAPSRRTAQVDDAFVAMVKFENGSVGTFEATRFGIGCKNGNAFQIHGSGGMLRFNLERLNHLEFVDASEPSTEQGPRDLLVTDMKHPIFGNFWRPGPHHRLRAHLHRGAGRVPRLPVARASDFHPNFADALAVQRVLDALQRSAKTRQWTDVAA